MIQLFFDPSGHKMHKFVGWTLVALAIVTAIVILWFSLSLTMSSNGSALLVVPKNPAEMDKLRTIFPGSTPIVGAAVRLDLPYNSLVALMPPVDVDWTVGDQKGTMKPGFVRFFSAN